MNTGNTTSFESIEEFQRSISGTQKPNPDINMLDDTSNSDDRFLSTAVNDYDLYKTFWSLQVQYLLYVIYYKKQIILF